MKITLVVVGRTRGALAAPVEEYEKRAGRYFKLEVVEVAAGARDGSASAVKKAEAERILARVPDGHRVWALTRVGSQIDSRGLADELSEAALRSSPGIVFVIGGAFGLDESVLERSDRSLSLSSMTLPHEMARLVLAEQLYRAGTIARGEPYHKG